MPPFFIGVGKNEEQSHQSLPSILHAAKRLPADISDADLQGWIDAVIAIVYIYTELNHDFGVTLRNAAPDMFTFVMYLGMPTTNNASKRTLRPVMLHKKMRQTFHSLMCMQIYSTLMTCMMTWKAQDKNLLEKIYKTIMAI